MEVFFRNCLVSNYFFVRNNLILHFLSLLCWIGSVVDLFFLITGCMIVLVNWCGTTSADATRLEQQVFKLPFYFFITHVLHVFCNLFLIFYTVWAQTSVVILVVFLFNLTCGHPLSFNFNSVVWLFI